MCGIAGAVSVEGVDPLLTRRMCRVIDHRGPDGEGFHDEPHASLGMRRLAVIDIATGDQPVYNECGSVVAVFNGEVYNFAELRAELEGRGHRFTTRTDSECLVHLYERYGENLVRHLRGMFAFAVWDSRRCRLVLGRDRFGKKPLYYRTDGKGLRFASELKSFTQDAQMPRQPDLVALHHYLTFGYVPAPRSVYQGVSKLPPGHVLVWQDGTAVLRRYWRLDFTPRPATDEHEEADRLRALLLEATRMRMVSDRPLGAFLSGGIDSSAVVAAMAMLSPGRVKTFSVGFAQPSFDERGYARALARRYHTDHHEVVLTPSAGEFLTSLAWHFDEPFADSSALPTFCLARMSGKHATVVLTGDGGDEMFGGYRRYALMRRAGRLALPPPAGTCLGRLGDGLAAHSRPRSRRRDVARVLQLLAHPVNRRYGRIVSCFTAEQKRVLYTDALRDQIAVDSEGLLAEAWRSATAPGAVGRLMEVDVHTYLPGDLLTKVDLATMAHALEARSPLLDHHLAEWAAALPDELRVRGGQTKYLLRKAVEPWLPAPLLHRPKAGFGVPLADWLRGELRDFTHDLLTDATSTARGLFRPQAVRALLREHQAGHDHADRIWALTQLEQWHRHFGPDQAPPSSRPLCQG